MGWPGHHGKNICLEVFHTPPVVRHAPIHRSFVHVAQPTLQAYDHTQVRVYGRAGQSESDDQLERLHITHGLALDSDSEPDSLRKQDSVVAPSGPSPQATWGSQTGEGLPQSVSARLILARPVRVHRMRVASRNEEGLLLC